MTMLTENIEVDAFNMMFMFLSSWDVVQEFGI